MDARGLAVCIPEAPDDDLARVPIIDLKSGYVLRSVDALPKQGAVAPWRLHQNYIKDVRMLRRGPIDDGVSFATREQAAHAAVGAAAESAVGGRPHAQNGHETARPAQALLDGLVSADGAPAEGVLR
jgi:hypothetical protein